MSRLVFRSSIVLYALLLPWAGGCASPQRLSDSIYHHEERARALDAEGAPDAAAAQRREAERERMRLGSQAAIVNSRETW